MLGLAARASCIRPGISVWQPQLPFRFAETFGELHSEHLLAALERMRHDCGNRKKPPSQAGDMGENA